MIIVGDLPPGHPLFSPYKWSVRLESGLVPCSKRLYDYTHTHRDLPAETRQTDDDWMDLVVDDVLVAEMAGLIYDKSIASRRATWKPWTASAALRHCALLLSPAMEQAVSDPSTNSAVLTAVQTEFDRDPLYESMYPKSELPQSREPGSA